MLAVITIYLCLSPEKNMNKNKKFVAGKFTKFDFDFTRNDQANCCAA